MTEHRILHWDPVGDPSDPGPEPGRWIAFLHGIYGSGRNWNSVARRVVRSRPEWGAAMVDLREHGSSIGFPSPHTVEAAARDLHRTVREADLELQAVLGHSFGGKVAMEYVRLGAEDGASLASLPRQLWVVDSTPAAREPDGVPWEMLGLLRAHEGPFTSREAAVAALESEGIATPVARWMALNLEEGDDGADGARAVGWRIDPDTMEALLRDFFQRDLWAVIESPPDGVEVHVVRATGSGVLAGEALERMRDAAGGKQVHLHEVEGGHWVNAENPDRMVALLEEWLP